MPRRKFNIGDCIVYNNDPDRGVYLVLKICKYGYRLLLKRGNETKRRQSRKFRLATPEEIANMIGNRMTA